MVGLYCQFCVLGRLTALWIQGVMTDADYLTVEDSLLGR
jgi:hypothetical protein